MKTMLNYDIFKVEFLTMTSRQKAFKKLFPKKRKPTAERQIHKGNGWKRVVRKIVGYASPLRLFINIACNYNLSFFAAAPTDETNRIFKYKNLWICKQKNPLTIHLVAFFWIKCYLAKDSLAYSLGCWRNANKRRLNNKSKNAETTTLQ